MAESPQPIERKLGELQARFIEQLPSKVAALAYAVEEITLANAEREKIHQAHRLAHSLVGISGTFGAPVISEKARTVEARLKEIINLKTAVSKLDLRFVDDAIKHLKRAVDAWEAPTGEIWSRREGPAYNHINDLVYVVDDDRLLLERINTYLTEKGYQVKCFSHPDEFVAACEKSLPSAVVMDMVMQNSDIAGSDVIIKMKQKYTDFPPAIFISVRSDMEARLSAANSGAKRYITKPFDMLKLEQTLEGIILHSIDEPYRVLIIDDDVQLLDFYKIVLENSGIRTICESDPACTLDLLKEHSPDMIILDVYMPGYNGLEISQVIRQDDTWANIPIMFLSTEPDFDKQLTAITYGGDDFLTKPIQANQLVKAVRARTQRSRWIAKLNRDLKNTLRESEYQRIAMNHHDLVSITDTAGNITFANSKFCEISGYAESEFIGKNHRMLKSNKHSQAFYQELWSTISSGNVWHGKICNQARDGSYYWVEATIVPFLDDHGIPYQYVSVRTDITETLKREETLSKSQVFANIGSWDWDLKTNQLSISERVTSLFGLQEGLERIDFQKFITAVHPDDQQFVLDALEGCKHNGKEFVLEHRIITPQNTIRWLMQKGAVVWEERMNEPLHMLGLVQDVTEQKELLAYQAKRGEFLRNLDRVSRILARNGDIDDVLSSTLKEVLEIFDMDRAWLLYPCNPASKRWNVPVEVTRAGISAAFGDKEEKVMDDLLRDYLRQVFESYTPIVTTFDENHYLKEFSDQYKVKSQIVMAIRPRNDQAWMLGLHDCTGTKKWDKDDVRLFQELSIRISDALTNKLLLNKIGNELLIRKKTERALIQAKEQAENANKEKSIFLSRMSHELRTPLNAILGFSQLLMLEDFDETSESRIKDMHHAGEHLLNLINEILDLSKIEAGKIEINIQPESIQDSIESALSLVQLMAEQSSITLTFTPDWSVSPRVLVDKIRLKQILLNLITNAIKYNKPEGKVVIACSAESDNRVKIDIIDTGVGLNVEQKSQLFKPFNRLGAEDSKIEGTGIGLVITKSLVEIMHGELRVESELNKGTTITIILPAA